MFRFRKRMRGEPRPSRRDGQEIRLVVGARRGFAHIDGAGRIDKAVLLATQQHERVQWEARP